MEFYADVLHADDAFLIKGPGQSLLNLDVDGDLEESKLQGSVRNFDDSSMTP